MRKFSYTITDPLGMHARPAGLFVKKASEFECDIIIYKNNDDKKVNAKRIFAVMGLAIRNGDVVNLQLDGSDEDIAAEKLEQFMKETL